MRELPGPGFKVGVTALGLHRYVHTQCAEPGCEWRHHDRSWTWEDADRAMREAELHLMYKGHIVYVDHAERTELQPARETANVIDSL